MKLKHVWAGHSLPTGIEKIRNGLFFFIVLAFIGCASSAQDNQPGIFYRITGNGLKDTSYLFGTYHQINNGYIDGLPQVKRHFSEAKGVVLELVLDSSGTKASRDATIMKDNSLTAFFDKPILDSLDAELRSNVGVGVEQADNMKPAFIMLLLSIGYLRQHDQQQIDRYTGQQMDAWFVDAGKQMGKTVTALQTVDEQINLLFGGSMESQASRVKKFLRNSDAMHQLDDDMLQSWFRHDLNRMNDSYQKTLQIMGEEDKLIKERNLVWINRLPGMLQQGAQFIALGALHLPGKYGLVHMLQEKGYTLIPVKP